MIHERHFLNPDDERVYIDSYIANLGENRDAIMVIPGGAYHEVCTDREGEPVALAFFAKGYNAFVLNYRVGGEGDVFPKQLLDAGSAMIYIRNHAEKFKINPDRVFAVGFSAGGHLCGSISTMFDFPEVVSAFGEEHIKVRPTGAILSYPVTTLNRPTHYGSFMNLLGKSSPRFTEEEKLRYSIECNVSEKSAPMFIWHTLEDTAVPPIGSIHLAGVLSEKKLPYMMCLYPYGPHGISVGTSFTAMKRPEWNQPIAAEWVNTADSWMKTLK